MSGEPRRAKDRRSDALDAALDLLGQVRKRLAYVDQRMDDMAAGWPTGGEGGTETVDGEALEYGSSTEANALNPKRDVVGPDKRRRRQLLEQITKAAHEIDDIDRKYLGGGDGTKPPDPPGCAIVGKVVGKDGRPAWEPVYCVTDGRRFLSEPMAEPVPVGKWAHDFMARTGRCPFRREIEAHLAGRAVKAEPVDAERPAKLRRRGWRRGPLEMGA